MMYESGSGKRFTAIKQAEEHPEGCDSCSEYLRKMHLPEETALTESTRTGDDQEEASVANRAEKEQLRKGFRRKTMI